ncbi:MAG: hypothetical protein IPF92_13065 [Myxococcales bacterium]|nr:hypothetical protein [Myxococcales bacterium]
MAIDAGDAELKSQLRSLTTKHGVLCTAKRLRCAPSTLARFLGDLPVRNGTRPLFREGLARIDAEERRLSSAAASSAA